MTAEGGVHAPLRGTSAVHVRAPGIGEGGIAVALAAEAIVTATNGAPDISRPGTESTPLETGPVSEIETGETV